MSKLEVREIGPISGETDLTLGQSGGTVTLSDGATAVGFGGGKVLHYDFMFQNTEITTSSEDWLDTGFELNFTPKSDTSRLRITASLKVESHMDNSLRSGKTYFRLWRHDSTIIEIERGYYSNMNVTNENRRLTGWLDFNYVDRPNTTSTINYKIKFKNGNTNSTVFTGSQIGIFEIMEIGA